MSYVRNQLRRLLNLHHASHLPGGDDPDETTLWEWHISVVCQNEAARIAGCLASIREAVGSRRALVTLNLNGTTDKSGEIARRMALDCGLPLRIYRTPAADKANALNRFIYSLRVPARMYVFIDGYVRIGPAALEGLEDCLATHPFAMAATGVGINGRTMHLATKKTLEQGGVLHGQLHALRPEFLDRMVERKIRLPIGTYWGDGLMGSMAAHDLDAPEQPWDNGRIVGVREATYEIAVLSLFRPRDLQRHFRRKVRQMRGRLQQQALKAIIYRDGFAGLPADADDLVRDYLSAHRVPATSIPDRLFMALALRQIRSARKPDPADYVPHRVVLLEREDEKLRA